MGIVGAKAAVDRASALDHVGFAANEREQRSFIGGEAAVAKEAWHTHRFQCGEAQVP
jgi:hypothetical protein